MNNILKVCKIRIVITAFAVMGLSILMVCWCDVIYHLLKISENFELVFGSQKAGKHLKTSAHIHTEVQIDFYGPSRETTSVTSEFIVGPPVAHQRIYRKSQFFMDLVF